ncbi:hypothetical protein TKK_0019679 [Trichogramma kaykai]|uniref:Uncharacterized protein n=1 Tax=Trichogramma kaykai TaxID=54128 RepID=A0ABD2VRZ5_9HYME
MKLLVFWVQSKTITVLDEKEVKRAEKKARWGKSWFDIEVIEESNDEDWLNSLHVDTNGDIIHANAVATTPKHLIAAKKISKRNNNQDLKAKRKILEDNESAAFSNHTIFTESENETGVKVAEEREQQEKNDVASGTDIIQRQDGNENDQPPNKKKKRLITGDDVMVNFCFQNFLFEGFIYDDKKNFAFLISELSFEEQILVIVTKACNDIKLLIEKKGAIIRNPGLVFLAPGISIDENKLNDIKRLSRNKPNKMIRDLLLALIGESRLSRMTANTVLTAELHAVERMFYY